MATIKAADIIDALYALHGPHEWVSAHELTVTPGYGFGEGNGAARVDFFTARKEYRLQSRIYEVKVSRGDFRQDVKRGKYKRYLGHANHVIFIVPKGLVERKEVPEECGFATFDPANTARPIQVHKLGGIARWGPTAVSKPLTWLDVPILQLAFRQSSRLYTERLEHDRAVRKLEHRIRELEEAHA